jgi:hypothetical protein
MFSSKT